MTAELVTQQLMTVEDYLVWESAASEKHEYLAGVVYGVSGASNRHNVVAMNVLVSLGGQLKGKPCRPFNSDTKARIRLADHVRFYYPDAMVVCRPNSLDQAFQDEPTVILEVLSDSTRRVDENEKRAGYLSIPSLQTYVLLEQEELKAVVWRRGDQGFSREVYVGREAVIPLPEVGAQLALVDVYEGAE